MSAGHEGESQVWGLISTLVGGPAVWGGIGYGVDRLLDTEGVFLPIGVVVGFVTSFYIVYVKTQVQPLTPRGDSRPAAHRNDTGDDAPR